MAAALYVAAVLALLVGIAHSVLGERYILIRLFRRDGLPKLFGGTEFTARTLRFAWHVTTIAWWGFAAVLVQLAQGSLTASSVAFAIGITFSATGLVTLTASRGKHLAWPVFLAIGGIALYAGS
ncbi:MAG: hypothetical protein ACT6S0_18630 [Roseateles sp.]|uniref:hypothetical protein n=1 Tax=Roseateles sp. TaxID=1971397 RepID=UPI0040370099